MAVRVTGCTGTAVGAELPRLRRGVAEDDGPFGRADEIEVSAVRMRVASLEDVLTTKLLALSGQSLDDRPVLEIARTVREQTDWDLVRKQTRESPYAHAFCTLVEELEIAA